MNANAATGELALPIKALMVEDSEDDCLLVLRALQKADLEVDYLRVDSAVELQQALTQREWDIVVSDHNMPNFSGLEALDIVTSHNQSLPFIFVSGTLGEEAAINAMHAGAKDYIMKDNLSRLPAAVSRELQESAERKRNELNEIYYRDVLDTASDAIVSFDEKGQILFFNRGAENVFGYGCAETLGGAISQLLPIDERDIANWCSGLPCELRGSEITVPQGTHRDGSQFPLEITLSSVQGESGWRFTAIMRDISERLEIQARLEYQSNHDYLTDLPNRRLFNHYLQRNIYLAHRQNAEFAVLFLDLDRFKSVNDSFGHAAGDQLLIQVSRCLQNSLREMDVVSRFGGDEFAILIAGLEDSLQLTQIAQHLVEVLSQPFVISGHEFHVGASIGIAVYPSDGSDVESLVLAADSAMYKAKQAGRGCFEFYHTGLSEQARIKVRIEEELHRAIRNQEFEVHYQPQVDTASQQIVGLEALVRWRHPQKGLINPGDFIPLAEDRGLIIEISEQVLSSVCRAIQHWQRSKKPVPVAVNFCPRQFSESNLLEKFSYITSYHNVAPELIEVEITENLLMTHSQYVSSTLNTLRQMGCRVALDDFGTGYSSLGYLLRYPVDTVKIDRSFIQQISGTHNNSQVLPSAIIAMAQRMGMSVVAEGVETAAQFEFLQAEQCDRIQGYYFYKPMPFEQIDALLPDLKLH